MTPKYLILATAATILSATVGSLIALTIFKVVGWL